MKTKRFLLFLYLIVIVGLLAVPLAADTADGIVKPAECPTVVQSGEIDITIPAGETVGRVEQQFIRCPGMSIQVSGGSMLELPIIINVIAHHDYLILRAYLQEPQPGPVEVTIWWIVE